MIEDQLAYWKRRARDAEWRAKVDQREIDTTTRWALEAFAERRRLEDRCSFLYGKALLAGVSSDDLRGE